jgi:hypothetical protein
MVLLWPLTCKIVGFFIFNRKESYIMKQFDISFVTEILMKLIHSFQWGEAQC